MTHESITEKPLWFPREEEIMSEYWACHVVRKKSWIGRWKRKHAQREDFRAIFLAAEEAEAYISDNADWDGKPARPITLGDAMRSVRHYRSDGLELLHFSNGVWTVLKRWLAKEPV